MRFFWIEIAMMPWFIGKCGLATSPLGRSSPFHQLTLLEWLALGNSFTPKNSWGKKENDPKTVFIGLGLLWHGIPLFLLPALQAQRKWTHRVIEELAQTLAGQDSLSGKKSITKSSPQKAGLRFFFWFSCNQKKWVISVKSCLVVHSLVLQLSNATHWNGGKNLPAKSRKVFPEIATKPGMEKVGDKTKWRPSLTGGLLLPTPEQCTIKQNYLQKLPYI